MTSILLGFAAVARSKFIAPKLVRGKNASWVNGNFSRQNWCQRVVVWHTVTTVFAQSSAKRTDLGFQIFRDFVKWSLQPGLCTQAGVATVVALARGVRRR